MSQKYLYQLKTGEWIHHSQLDDTVVVRYYDPEYKEERFNLAKVEEEAKLDNLLQGNFGRVPLGTVRDLLREGPDPTSTPVGEKAKWREICEHLKALGARAFTPEPNTEGKLKTDLSWTDTIPETPLRHFYDFLRLFPTRDIHEKIAKYNEGANIEAKPLIAMFKDSVQAFERYNNSVDSFCPPRETAWRRALPDDHRDAIRLVESLNPQNWVLNPVRVIPRTEEALAFRPLNYEVNFRRTTGGAYYQSGRSARNSGLGGVDLLLRSEDGGLPIVGEIKARGDTNMFFALIQALMHAVELTTPNQFRRLLGEYGEAFAAISPETCRCDVYLIFFSPYGPPEEPPLISEAIAVADHLITDSIVSQKVRQIAFIERSPGGEFICRHVSRQKTGLNSGL